MYGNETLDPVRPVPRDARYLRRLLLLLASANFFQGYDTQIISLLLPNIQGTFHVSEATLGLIRIPIDLGLLVAFLVARQADRVGRRAILLWSVAAYTVCTALTAVSWDIWSFTAFQFVARVFLGAEYAIGITMVVEEFPAARRGRALGWLLAFAAFGAIAAGVLLAVGLSDGPLGWRSFYLAGLVPLLALIVYRRNIEETRLFTQVKAHTAPGTFLVPWQPRYRRNLVLIGLTYLLISIPHYAALGWWAFFAERERGFTTGDVALFIICAYSVGCAGYVVCGRAMERIGRVTTARIYCVGAMTFTILVFQVSGKPLSFAVFMLAVFFSLGIWPVMSAFATELFPTEIRGQTTAWIRNVFEIGGTVSGPALVGVLADHSTGAIGNVGDTVTALSFLFLPALWLISRYVPDTSGKLLETTPAGVHEH